MSLTHIQLSLVTLALASILFSCKKEAEIDCSKNITVNSSPLHMESHLRVSDYDENKHFFLGHFFRDNYNFWLESIPEIRSGLNITRIEIHKFLRTSETLPTKKIIAFQDLGEGSVIFNNLNGKITGKASAPTSNNSNNLYEQYLKNITRDYDLITDEVSSLGMVFSKDFIKVKYAIKLNEDQYSINKELGYISLIRKLQDDEILAVAFEYTINGKIYKVGEFAEDQDNAEDLIFLKLLKTNLVDTRIPSWNLMMKNIYALSFSQIENDDLSVDISYKTADSSTDSYSIPEGKNTTNIPLLELLKMDQIDDRNNKQSDGVFDLIEGITIDSYRGLLKFPVIEPFGETLKSYFEKTENSLVEKYVFNELYDEHSEDASNHQNNIYYINYTISSSGIPSQISLPLEVPDGKEIEVFISETKLAEEVDYAINSNNQSITIFDTSLFTKETHVKIKLLNGECDW